VNLKVILISVTRKLLTNQSISLQTSKHHSIFRVLLSEPEQIISPPELTQVHMFKLTYQNTQYGKDLPENKIKPLGDLPPQLDLMETWPNMMPLLDMKIKTSMFMPNIFHQQKLQELNHRYFLLKPFIELKIIMYLLLLKKIWQVMHQSRVLKLEDPLKLMTKPMLKLKSTKSWI